MTDLRVAAQQALWACKLIVSAFDALKPASAARNEPLQINAARASITALEAALAEPVQEPVAFAHINGTSDTKWHPPQRKPLTEKEIDSIWDSEKAFADIYAIARAVERAHGIDGAPEERNFCPRCGKRTNGIHTCTPPAPLTDEVIAELWHKNGGFHHHFARAIERWLRGHA